MSAVAPLPLRAVEIGVSCIRPAIFLIRDIERNGYSCIGKPEPLRGNLSGWWSVRIDAANRLVFRIAGQGIVSLSCRGHYGD